MPSKQRHDLGRRKWELSEPARREAERRRSRRQRLLRRKHKRAARQVDPADITAYRAASRKSGS